MIVITGTGRSGTSALAALYDRCGFSPGGRWTEALNAGLEDRLVVDANDLVAHDLRMTMTGPPRRPVQPLPPNSALGRLSARYDLYHRWDVLPGRRARHVRPLDWERLDTVVARHGARLRAIADGAVVAKDPRFSWTLPVWLAAGARIDHVVFTTRDLESMLESRRQNRLMSFSSRSAAKNALIYGTGVCLSACWDYSVPLRVLRFPEFLDDLPGLHRLPLLCDLDFEELTRLAGEVFDRNLVHHTLGVARLRSQQPPASTSEGDA